MPEDIDETLDCADDTESEVEVSLCSNSLVKGHLASILGLKYTDKKSFGTSNSGGE